MQNLRHSAFQGAKETECIPAAFATINCHRGKGAALEDRVAGLWVQYRTEGERCAPDTASELLLWLMGIRRCPSWASGKHRVHRWPLGITRSTCRHRKHQWEKHPREVTERAPAVKPAEEKNPQCNQNRMRSVGVRVSLYSVVWFPQEWKRREEEEKENCSSMKEGPFLLRWNCFTRAFRSCSAKAACWRPWFLNTAALFPQSLLTSSSPKLRDIAGQIFALQTRKTRSRMLKRFVLSYRISCQSQHSSTPHMSYGC